MMMKNVNVEMKLRNILLKLRNIRREIMSNEDIEIYCNELEEIEEFMCSNSDYVSFYATDLIHDLVNNYVDKIINESQIIHDINELSDEIKNENMIEELDNILYILIALEYSTLYEFGNILENAIDAVKELIKEVI